MKNPQKISIPSPCSESWDAMRNNDSGRFCNACQKTVIDFTKMSDEDFVAYFQHIKIASCGRFLERQLSIEIPKKPSPLLPFGRMSKYIAASMIAATGLSGKVFGQKVETVQISEDKIQIKKEDDTSSNESYISMMGSVIDEKNNSIPGARVKISNSNTATITDINGRFNLQVPKSSTRNNHIYLEINSPGYQSKELSVNQKNYNNSISINLHLEYSIMGGIAPRKKNVWQDIKEWLRLHFF